MTAADLVVAQLDAMLAATPAPPLDADPEELVETFAVIASARERLIAALTELGAGAGDDTRIRARSQTLILRDGAWTDALIRARLVVGDRLTAVRRARLRDR